MRTKQASNPAIGCVLPGLTILAALFLVPPVFFEHEPWPRPAYLQNDWITSFLPQALPCLALVAAAALLAAGLNRLQSQGEEIGFGKLAALAALGLSGLILVGGFYHLYWLFVWDSTYDPLTIILLFLPVMAALAGAATLAVLLHKRRGWIGLVYAVFAVGAIMAVFLSAKLVDYRALTESRAARIARALERYHARQGTYPQSLEQLQPWTMLSITEPVIMHGQKWCYQGEKDAYRLGYLNREHWSSPELFTTVAQTQGRPSASGDVCADEIAQMKAVYPGYYEISTNPH